MAKLTLPLREKKEVATGTMAFHLDMGTQALAFQPGQFVRVTLIRPPYTDEKGDGRSFSIASAPGEPLLMVATRMTGTAFKRSLADLPAGSNVAVNGPFGDFVLEAKPARPALLLAGGIGITPFRSMIGHAIAQDRVPAVTLVYSNRTPEDSPFLEELQGWSKQNSQFRLLATMTQPQNSKQGWTGPTGYVDAAFIKAQLPDVSRSTCYIAGPPRFVAAVSEALAASGVNPADIRTDEFSGY